MEGRAVLRGFHFSACLLIFFWPHLCLPSPFCRHSETDGRQEKRDVEKTAGKVLCQETRGGLEVRAQLSASPLYISLKLCVLP